MSGKSKPYFGNPCPQCGGESQVRDSRPTYEGWTRRRRFCVACDIRWTTYELAADSLQALVGALGAITQLQAALQQLGPVIEPTLGLLMAIRNSEVPSAAERREAKRDGDDPGV